MSAFARFGFVSYNDFWPRWDPAISQQNKQTNWEVTKEQMGKCLEAGHGAVKQNQTKLEITFDVQLNDAFL